MSTENPSIVQATREIPAAAADIFNLLSNPQRHKETDGTGTVVSSDHGERIHEIGDIFTMNMTNANGDDYQTSNEVYVFQPDRQIGWINECNVTKDVPVGAKWLYELEPIDAHNTKVTLTYDPTELKSDGAKSASKNFDQKALDSSLAALAEALA